MKEQLSTYLTLTQVYDFITAQPTFFLTKLTERISHKLKRTVSKDEAEDVVNDTLLKVLEAMIRTPTKFNTLKEFEGYMIQSCWWNYRDDHTRQAKHEKRHLANQPDYIQECTQLIPRSTVKAHRFDSIDVCNDEFEAEPERDSTDADLTDEYYTRLYEKLFAYLEHCIQDEYLTFQEVGIYKMYILNNWTVRKVSEHSDFSKSTCSNAISKIKKHLATVDWRL